MSTTQPAAITCTNLAVNYDDGTSRYHGEPVLTDVNLNVEPGEILGILGASGAGKSTLLRAVAGLQHPKSGRIEIQGQITDDGAHHTPPHLRNCTMVFQDAQLFPHRNVAKNVAYGLQAAGVPVAQQRKEVARVLELVEISELAHRPVTRLSGGQAQRVALARCLVIKPAVILFDEPLSALDRGLRQRLATDIRRLLKHTGTSAMYVTHDPTEATTVADRLAVVEAGKLHDLGAVSQLDVSSLPPSMASLLGGLGDITGVVTAVNDESTTVEVVDKILVVPGRQGVIGDIINLNIRR